MLVKYCIYGGYKPFCFQSQNLSLIVLGIGTVFSIIFHLGTRELKPAAGPAGVLEDGEVRVAKRWEEEEEEEEGEEEELRPLISHPQMSRTLLQWKCWLRQPSFYQVYIYTTYIYINFKRCQVFSKI